MVRGKSWKVCMVGENFPSVFGEAQLNFSVESMS